MSTINVSNLKNASAANPAIVLAADGSATANLSSLNGGPIAGSRNRIINGGMDIWQRGTSFSATGYTADRWNATVAGTTTFSQETSIVPAGAQYALKWTTGAASSYGQLRQFIEQLNVSPLRGQTVTASAYVRSGGTFAGNIVFEIFSNASSDSSVAGGWTQISTTTSGTINSSSYTQIKTTFTVPANAVGLYFGIVPDAAQASGAIVYQSLAQLEPGTVATPFERRSYGQELALCQRYYSKSFAVSLAGPVAADYTGNMGWGQSIEAAAVSMSVRFPVEMRATPTVTIYSPTSATAGTFRVWQAGVDRTGSAGNMSSSGFATISKSGAADLSPSGTQTSAVQWIASIEL